jgi:GNAT superfamily N-acetyltransferase
VPADREALAQMFERCTTATRHHRFHGPVKAMPERYLAEALSGSPFHHALVACLGPDTGDPHTGEAHTGEAHTDEAHTGEAIEPNAPPGEIVALASCRMVDEGAAELGLLIEDAWQRHGLGTRLLRDLVAHARRTGLRALEAQLLADQAWITGLLRPYGSCRIGNTWDGVLNVTVRLDP